MVLAALFAFCFSSDVMRTNEFFISKPPSWLTTTKVEKVTQKIQHKLEWSTRRVNVRWFDTEYAFQQAHSLGPRALAVTKYSNGQAEILMGPHVNAENFDEIFGHEIVHVILFQKYKAAIPKWLEEGLANHLAKRGRVDYVWLSQQDLPSNVLDLAHPFQGSAEGISLRYKASQALAEMLESKCNLENLIRLSVERKMEDYIKTYCGLNDINKSFREWVKEKGASAKAP